MRANKQKKKKKRRLLLKMLLLQQLISNLERQKPLTIEPKMNKMRKIRKLKMATTMNHPILIVSEDKADSFLKGTF